MTRFGFAVALLLLGIGPGVAKDPDPGYIFPSANLHIQAWLPSAPPRDSLAQAADVETILQTRTQLDAPRGAEAYADDVYQPAEVAPRFAYVLGITLDEKTAPHTLHLMQRVSNDAQWLTAPVKKSVTEGGLQRPFVDYPNLHTCPITYDKLPKTGSYPSGHASLGWLWGSILAEIVPDHADALLARGIDFGQSRVVCGFHYPSDIVAGRLAAAALLDRLRADEQFNRDVEDARNEIGRLLRKHA